MKAKLYGIMLIIISSAMLGFVVFTVYPCFVSDAPGTVTARVDELVREIPVDETSDVKFINVSYRIGLHKYRKVLSHEHYYTGLDVGDTIEVVHYKKTLNDFSATMRIELTALSIGGIIIMTYGVSVIAADYGKKKKTSED